MNANENQKPKDAQREAGLAAPLGSASWGVTRRFGKLVMDGDKRAVQIEIDAKDERRLRVLLSKAMRAVAYAEVDVEMMTDSTITKYLDDQAKCFVTVTPND